MNYIGNSFSLQMIPGDGTISIKSVAASSVPENALSIIGHADTAVIVSNMLGRKIEYNRERIVLGKNDTLYIAQLTGGRLPEGSTRLPDGFNLSFIEVRLLDLVTWNL